MNECIARSLSVFDEYESAIRLKKLLPAMRMKPIFEIPLQEKDGLILQTSNDLHHYSWWRSTEFNLDDINISDV